MNEPALPSPVLHAPDPHLPVILSVPHSGRELPDGLARLASGGAKSVLALADPLVDRLVDGLIAKGHGAVIAKTPRGVIDCNRPLDSLDPAVILDAAPPANGSRAAQGLGLVPARSRSKQPLWMPPLDRTRLEARIASAWQPYHDALEAMIDTVAARHGGAILIDCHSMPPRRGGPALVIGDRHGTSAAPWVSQAAGAPARGLAFATAFNHPFAGGYIAERHGDPARNIHVLQLELDRGQYLDPLLSAAGPGFSRGRLLFERIAGALVDAWFARGLEAAE